MAYQVSVDSQVLAIVHASQTSTRIDSIDLTTAQTLTVVALDAAGNMSSPLSVLVQAKDLEPPLWSPDTSVIITAVGDTSVSLSWTPAKDEFGVLEYRIVSGEAVLHVTAGETEATVTGLAPLSDYSVDVVAVDAAGNISGPNPSVEFQTPDTMAPAWVVGSVLSFESVDVDSLKVAWPSNATDAGGLAAYHVFQDKVLVGTVEYLGTDTATELVISGLSAVTAYTFTVQALDVAGNLSTDGPTGIIQMADTAAPVWPASATIIASNITPDSLTLAWSAANDDVGTATYLVHQNGQEVSTVSTTHVDIQGLSPWTEYTFTAWAVDGAGNQSSQGPVLTLKTPDASQPVWPSNAELTATAVAPSSLTLVWPQATDDVSVVHHHVLQDGVVIATLDGASTSFDVTGLTPWTDYGFSVRAEDQAGNMSTGELSLNIKTPDKSAPIWAPGQLVITNIAPTSLTLVWPTATDDASVASWSVTMNGVQLATVAPALTTFDVVGLTPWTDYIFTVTALDGAGNASSPLEQAAKTSDSISPIWSQGAALVASNITGTSLDLAWPMATDDVGIASYLVTVNGGSATTVDGAASGTTLSNLVPGTTIWLQVRAVDAAGNTSITLNLTVTMPDGGPPTWHNAMLTALPSSFDATLAWDAASDDIGVVAYRIFMDGQQVVEVAETQAVVSGLLPNTVHTFKVEAGDAAGNWSSDGPSVTVSTVTTDDPGFRRLTKYQVNRSLADILGYIWEVGCSHDYSHLVWTCDQPQYFSRDAETWYAQITKDNGGAWFKYMQSYPDDQHIPSPGAFHGGFKRLDSLVLQAHVSAWISAVMNFAANNVEGWVGHARILGPCWAANNIGLTNYASDTETHEACISNFIHDLGKRAFRRPVTAEEHAYFMETYMQSVQDHAQTGAYGNDLPKRGLRDVIVNILLSPQFVYQVELGDENGKLTSWELASRLSFHFWDTMPDDELFAAAEDGSLLTPEGYQAQVERLFADPKARRSIEGFYKDYFRVQDLKNPNLQDFPGYTLVFYHEGGQQDEDGPHPVDNDANGKNWGILWSMERELLNLGNWFTSSNPGTFEEMFRSNLHFLQCPGESCDGAGPWSQTTYEIDGTCTDYYDCAAKQWFGTGNGWDGVSAPITLPEPERAGLLTRMPMLTHDTHAARPIRRGLAIREMLLCDPVPPPENCDVVKPPNVTGMCESAEGTTGISCSDDQHCESGETCVGWDKEATMTVREKVEALTEVPGTTCANCHSTLINGFGHALGHFSSVGKYWEKEHMFTTHKDQNGNFTFYNIEPPDNWPEIDTSGTTILNGQWVSFDGPHEVADLLVDSGKMEWCWSREYFRYAIGRFDKEADAAVIEQMAESLRTGTTLAEAYKAIAYTPQFKTLVSKPKAAAAGGTP
ncbi:MAG: fibronectin type III domain-containing protein [Myxococcota bacterium]|nr:fibronectin type III domain-containing protein [Myxococcota bacterium]